MDPLAQMNNIHPSQNLVLDNNVRPVLLQEGMDEMHNEQGEPTAKL